DDILELDDLADDVADFLARRSRLELRKLRQVDRVDQRIEHRRLDVVVLFRVPALRLGNRLWPARCCCGRSGQLSDRGNGGLWRYDFSRSGITRTLTKHLTIPQSLIFSFWSSGPSAVFGACCANSLRWARVMASSRNGCTALAFLFSSSTICPLFAACPKFSASNSIVAAGFRS